MILWLSSSEDRIISWRKYRQFLETLNFDDALDNAEQIWRHAPKINKIKFDMLDIDQWPDPWQLLSNQTYCNLSQALGLFYTICLSKHSTEEIAIQISEDDFGELHAVVITKKHKINFMAKKQINNLKPIKTYHWEDFKRKKIYG